MSSLLTCNWRSSLKSLPSNATVLSNFSSSAIWKYNVQCAKYIWKYIWKYNVQRAKYIWKYIWKYNVQRAKSGLSLPQLPRERWIALGPLKMLAESKRKKDKLIILNRVVLCF